MAETNLCQSRKSLKSSLTRIQNFVKNFNSEEHDFEQLVVKLERLNEIWSKYLVVQDKLEELDSAAHEDDRDGVEEQYDDTKALINKLIKEETQSVASTVPLNNASASPAVSVLGTAEQYPRESVESKLNLPKLSIPPFGGNYQEWRSFNDLFTAIIHENNTITNIEKLFYLKSTLKGEALKTIESIPVTSENYQVAYNILSERYNQTNQIITSHLNNFLSLPVVTKYSTTALRTLISNAKQQIEALRALQVPVQHWDIILIHIVAQKLDMTNRRDWELHKPKKNPPTLTKFFEYLETRCSSLEAVEPNEKPTKPKTFTQVTSSKSQQCYLCKENHRLYTCTKFLALNVNDRISTVKAAKVCFNCLNPGHIFSKCHASNCKKCGKKHNTTIHQDREQDCRTSQESSSQEAKKEEAVNSEDNKSKSKVYFSSAKPKEVLLSTAVLLVRNQAGEWIECRALLDSASQSNFASDKVINKLNLKPQSYSISISGIRDTNTKVTKCITLQLASRIANYHRDLNFLVLDKITNELPASNITSNTWKLPKQLKLADPTFSKPGEIDLLIGAELYFEMLKHGQIKLGKDLPIMQNSVFGWIISGKIVNENPQQSSKVYKSTSLFTSTVSTTDEILTKFWELEDFSNKAVHSKEERECEEHFVQTVKRNDSGRYIVQLPCRTENNINLGESYNLALRRLNYLLRRLQQNEPLLEQYQNFLDEYLRLEHMEEVTNINEVHQPRYYIPHHPIIKEESTSTKLRVVFDASMKSNNGVSLNDILKVGPTVQEDLLSIVLRFRLHKYVFTTDIKKMYRQVLVDPNQTNLQLILWKKPEETEVKTYRLKTVTYGTASAPFLATRCLQQLAFEEGDQYPFAKSAILHDCYVDDIMTGTSDLDIALKTQHELTELLSKGKFPLHKWCSNNSEILENVEPCNRETRLPLAIGNAAVKTLGLLWLPAEDIFKFVIKKNEQRIPITKRAMLSDIASIFDPLGLLGPVIIKAKILMQQLWKEKISWDEELNENLVYEWQKLRNELSELQEFTVDRKVISIEPYEVNYELHGFADASQVAYGACLFLKSYNNRNEVSIHLIAAKSKVAPIKPTTIPRLELCAVLTLSRLVKKVSTSLQLPITKTYLWTDSMITLHWILSDPTKYKQFVGNRVNEVQELTSQCIWRHVPTCDNPADYLSRGMSPMELKNSITWWNGPVWLQDSEENWPNASIKPDKNVHNELKPQVCATASYVSNFNIFDKFSKLLKLQRVTAYCLRFITNAKSPTNRQTGILTATELKSSLNCLVRCAQAEHFADEIETLENGQVITKGPLKGLTPFLDKNYLLRLGGRLQNAELTDDCKHQIILPRSHKITTLILREEHVRLMHAGTQAVLASIREVYWPIQGRNTIRKIIHQCVKCYRFKTKQCTQLMGSLPSYRTQLVRPFANTGVDYGGPILLKVSSRRKAPIVKAYIALFVCLATRAIHIELVSSLSTDSYLSAFKRFISRRGKCTTIMSDNATNFKGANHELRELYQLFQNEATRNEIITSAANLGIIWKFIPPNAPHFGGIWEAGIKAVKHHLKRVVGNLKLPFEEYYTILTQIEACINSRPICPLSDDPTDYSALTPSHFLIGSPLTALPEPSLTELPDNTLSKWQMLQKQMQLFWKRWSHDYLNTMQQRTKWTKPNPNIKPGDMVLVKEDNQPPLSWPVARVKDVHPGQDGLVRVATIITPTGTYKRPIVKLALLPIADDNTS